jgi:SAM-dependent methyltransferase
MAGKLLRDVIKALYEAAKRSRGSFEEWRRVRAPALSEEGRRALRRLAQSLGLQLESRDDEMMLLFALETYIAIVVRAIASAKLRKVAEEVLGPSLFSWVFDMEERQRVDVLLEVVTVLNLSGVAFDVFREVYRSILPREVRRSVGEFYTGDAVVDEVLDSAGLDAEAIRQLYERWKRGERDTVILDPACGSGSFLTAVVRRIFSAFSNSPPGDITDFIEENVVGIDVNPLAVEMAKLNVAAAIAEEMAKRGIAYTPRRVNIYWADSLAKSPEVQGLLGRCSCVVGNPPWVRIHRLDARTRKYVAESYSWVGRGCAFDPKFKKTVVPFTQQIDYSIAFVQRGFELLREGGVLAYVITSQVVRATYAGRLREELLKYTILRLVDYSLHPVPLFPDAVSYPLVFAVRKSPPPRGHKVRVTVYNTAGDRRDFELEQEALPLYPNAKSPWVLAPPEVRRVAQKITANSQRLGDVYEAMMGVTTSLNGQYIGKFDGCGTSTVKLELEDGREAEVEEFLVHPLVRGRDVRPYGYRLEDYIIFPHDSETLEPLWDPDQRRALELLGRGVGADGEAVVYEFTHDIRSAVQRLRETGFGVVPCGDACFKVLNTAGHEVLQIGLELRDGSVRLRVAGLRIPGAPLATRHFAQALKRLVSRSGYRPGLPPWTVFDVSQDKFEGYRIVWREIAKRLEAAYVPARVDVELCGRKAQRLIVVDHTAHFIIEKDPGRALRLLVYLNSDVARALVKLWSRAVRGGYYNHQSVSVGMLPLPRGLLDGTLWRFLDGYLESDLDAAAAKAVNERSREIEEELVKAFGITEDEYKALVEWGMWINEEE